MEHLQTSAATTGNNQCGHTLLVHLGTQHCKELWGTLFLNNSKYWTEQSADLYCISSDSGREIYQKCFYLLFKKQERWKDQRAFVQDQLLTLLTDSPLFGRQLVQQNNIWPIYPWVALQEQQQQQQFCCSNWKHNGNQGSPLSSQGTLHKIRNPVPRASDLSATRARGWRGGWRHSICTEGPRNPVGSGPGHARGSRGAKHPVPYAQVCPVGPLACLGILGEIFRKKSKHVHWHAFCFTVLTSACPVPPSTSIIISNTTLKLGNGEKSLLVKGYFFLLIEKKCSSIRGVLKKYFFPIWSSNQV